MTSKVCARYPMVTHHAPPPVAPRPGRGSAGANKGKEEVKALDYAKARYEGQSEKTREKIIREPKKLGKTAYEIQTVEGAEAVKVDPRKGLPTEQDLVTYTTPGLDYSKTKYETIVQKEEARAKHTLKPLSGGKSADSGRSPSPGPVTPPVNWTPIEKVAPPEITKNVRNLFESGQFTDLHQVQKLKAEDDLFAEGFVSENVPEIRENVVRESDFNMETEALQSGFTKSVREQFESGNVSTFVERAPIVIDRSSGPICLENEPIQLEGVVRANDPSEPDFAQPTMKLADRLAMLTVQKEVERKQIKLVEDDQAAPIVLESTPTPRRDDVIREHDDEDRDQIQFKAGHISNLKGFFTTAHESKIERKPIVIERSTEPTVLENEPEEREGVVREHDLQEDEKAVILETGHARKLADRWTHLSEQEPAPVKRPFQMDVASEGPIVLESTPVQRDDVVRCDDGPTEDILPGAAGRSKKLAERFLNWSEAEEQEPKPRKVIEIDRSQSDYILESTPVERDDVVKCGGPSGWEIEIEAGRTRNIKDQWLNAADEDSKSPTETQSSGGKPQWLIELEAAKEAGVFENEPEENPDVVRESDNLEQPDLIPERMTKNLRNMWLNREAEEDANREAEKSRQPEVHKRKHAFWKVKEPSPSPSPSPSPEPEPEPPKPRFGRGKLQSKFSKFEPAPPPEPKVEIKIKKGTKKVGKKKKEEPPPPEPEPVVAASPMRAKASMFGAVKLTKAEKDAIAAKKRKEEEERLAREALKPKRLTDTAWMKKRR